MKLVTLAVGFALVTFMLAPPAASQAASQTFKGYLVDVMCATHHASEGAAYGEKHDRKCLLMAECVKRGYALMMSDKGVVPDDWPSWSARDHRRQIPGHRRAA